MDRSDKLNNLLDKNIQSRIDFSQKMTGVKPAQEDSMKLSQLKQFSGVRWHVIEDMLVADGNGFSIEVCKDYTGGGHYGWYVHIIVEDSKLDLLDRYAGEYGIGIKWSRESFLSMVYACIECMLTGDKNQFPSQWLEWRI